MFEWKRIRRNKKIFDDLSLRFHRATFSNGKPFYDLFKLELIENEKADWMSFKITMKNQLMNDKSLMEITLKDCDIGFDGKPVKINSKRFDEQYYSRQMIVQTYQTDENRTNGYWDEIKCWCNSFGDLIYKYRGRLDEVEVLKHSFCNISYRNGKLEDKIFMVTLEPIDFSSYLETCKKTYKDFLYGDDYKDYIVKEFAEQKDNSYYDMSKGMWVQCGEYKKLHVDEPSVSVLTYNQWLNDIYLPELKQKENDEKIKDLVALVDEKRKTMPQV